MRNRTLEASQSFFRLAIGGALGVAVGCVPNGPASSSDGGSDKAPRPRASIAPYPANAPTANVANLPPNGRAPSPALAGTFEDNFERAALGPDWITTGAEWHI